MTQLSPYRDRIVESAEGVAKALPDDMALQFYMAGFAAGTDYLMCAALMHGTEGFTADGALNELKAYTAYRMDFERITGRRGHEQDDGLDAMRPGSLAS